MRRRRSPLMVALAVAVAGCTGTVATLLSRGSPSGISARSRAAAVAWDKEAGVAFHGLVEQVPAFSSKTPAWLAGSTSTGAYLTALGRYQDAVQSSLHLVTALPAAPVGGRTVNLLYAASVRLYADAGRLDRAATAIPAGPLRDQVVLMSRRATELADRIFDRGHDVLAAALPPPPVNPDVVTRLPTDVPEWAAEGMAAGPPLATPPGAPDRYPPLKEPPRPTQPDRAWLAAVSGSGAPRTPAVRDAARTGDPSTLGSLAARLTTAADALDRAADPVSGGVERSDRLRLALLVLADAARADQAAALGPAPAAGDLEGAGADLLSVGDSLRAATVGARS